LSRALSSIILARKIKIETAAPPPGDKVSKKAFALFNSPGRNLSPFHESRIKQPVLGQYEVKVPGSASYEGRI